MPTAEPNDLLEQFRDVIKEELASVRGAQAGQCAECFARNAPEAHHRHHDFMERWLQIQQRKQERWEARKNTIIGAVIIGVLGALGGWVTGLWKFIVDHWK